ncbi:MAG: nucleotide sugar dehydrogenase, partial [Flavobacteriia bacterium]|nr:nucleotide sugar dehydrogenase [Flavobacteriia bacterium]
YDISDKKINAYQEYRDSTGEVTTDNFESASKLEFTTDPCLLARANFVIIAVPTPVNEAKTPDFSPLISASACVGQYMRTGTTVIYESTVYPGATEEICIPILEKESGLKWLKDFHIGYSPERVNPGDKERTITKIVKLVSGDNDATLKAVSDLYGSVITAGVYQVGSIKIAEAAKVIENTQRDINIALVNELAIIFNKLGIDTLEVLQAASTKWNFLPFRPGLVGGHCIGVDPYYLTHKAQSLGYLPQIILAGRRINDGVAIFIANQTIKEMIDIGIQIKGAKIVLLGLTFKENCADIRNSKVFDLVNELLGFGCDVFAHDPIADPAEIQNLFGISSLAWDELPQADALVAAVSHQQYLDMPIDILLKKLKRGGVFIDVKSVYSKQALLEKNFRVWRL